MGGETHQYYPELTYDNHTVEAEKTPEEGYHLTEDLADKAISFIADAKQVAPNKPFFLYFCPGAAHAPHHVPKEWADKYKGKFDDGWDKLRERISRGRKSWVSFRLTLNYHATIPTYRNGSRCPPRKRNFTLA